MNNAVLAFEDGSVFRGKAFGAKKTAVGEVVFNTSMMGYEELLSSPSNYMNILTMTFVEVGCYGINEEDVESDSAKVSGLVVAQDCEVPSNWRCKMSLNDYLVKHGVPAISGIDTRAITRKLRDKGAMKACLSTEDISDADAIERAKQWQGFEGVDYVKDVSCKEAYRAEDKFAIKPFELGGVHIDSRERKTPLRKCVAIDFGANRSLLAGLAYNGFDVMVVPANTSAEEIEKLAPECVFLTDGAGDATALTYAHETVATLAKKYPTFAVGLGMQVLAYAFGGKTIKLPFGHHGGNHPVKNLAEDKVKITSQNNAFAVDAKSLEGSEMEITEVNHTDGSVAGIKHKSLNAWGVQYYPEVALLDKFYASL